MRVKDIPRQIIVGESLYDVKFKGEIESRKDIYGYCNGDLKEIIIKKGLSGDERAKTMIHELLHAIEFEYGLAIEHSLIYKLEEPIYNLIKDNIVCFIK